MRIKLSPLLNDARGKLGNMIFSVAASGVHYIRQKAAIASNPRSVMQQALRCHLAYLAHEWHDTVTTAQKNGWEEFAQNKKRVRVDENQGGGKFNLIPHSRGFISGWNAFIGINQRIYVCDGQPTNVKVSAPVGVPPYCITDLSASWDAIGEDIDLSWLQGDLGSDFLNPYVRVWIESYEAGAHKQLITCYDTSEEGADLVQARYALGILGDLVDHPGLYRLQFDVLVGSINDASGGLISPPSEVLEVTVP